ncbi:MAG: glycosyltransferase family 9 protein [Candidatus Omnitrophica bacterium]|nr:glycosyltransferase family 9 protein [Candidatus Omnitrophota bacterium]
MQNILVVNVNWLGDVIFSSPAFKALKEKYPESHVACLGVPRVAEVLEHIDGIDEVIVYEEKGCHASLLGKLRLINQLRKKRFDIVFLFHRSLTRALLVFMAGIPIRVGYDAKKRGMFLTHRVKPLIGVVHRSDFYLNVIEFFRIEVKDRNYYLKVYDEDIEFVSKLFKDNGIKSDDFVIVLNTGGNWDLKQWSEESFSFLIDQIAKEFRFKIVLTGGLKDVERVERIIAGLKNDVVNFAGKTNLSQLMGVMQRADVVISADSGPLHVASSVGWTNHVTWQKV